MKVEAEEFHVRISGPNCLETVGFRERLYLLVDIWRLGKPTNQKYVLSSQCKVQDMVGRK